MPSRFRPSQLASWLVLALLAWVLWFFAGQAATRTPDFDGALNFNVSRALIEGQGYGSFYETFRLFPIETQTNGPLVLPAALSMRLFGIAPFGLQATNLAYLFVFAALAACLLRRLGVGTGFAALGVLLALTAPGMRDYALNGYGEIPALTWMLAALLALARQFDAASSRWAFAAGLALGLSFLTKTVALIWFPAAIGLYLALRWQRDGWRLALRDALVGGAGIAVVLAAWELYRMASLGGVGGWISWWHAQYVEVRKQAGVSAGYLDTPGVLGKALHHGEALLGMLELPKAAGVAWLLAPFAAGALAMRVAPSAAQRYLLAAPLAVAACYLVWWIEITPTEFMWLRRIMLALVLMQLLAPALAWLLRAHPSRAVRALGWAALALAIALGAQHQLLWARPDARAAAAADQALFDAIRALPADAVLFGSGWWQAPVVALYTGRRVHDEEKWDEVRRAATAAPTFLVMDPYAVGLGTAMQERLQWRCDCEPVYLGTGGRIYRIRRFFDTPETSTVRRRRIDAAAVQGTGFAAETAGGVRWAMDEASLALAPEWHGTYVLSYVVPEPAWFVKESEPLRLTVSRGECVLSRIALQPGEQVALIEDDCPDDTAALRFETNGRLDPARIAPDTRALAWLFRSLEIYPAGTSD
jgi:hypothetical protein